MRTLNRFGLLPRARTCGVSTLHNFLPGAMPRPRIRMKLATHSLQGAGAGRAVEGVLAVLLSGMPESRVEQARRGLLGAVADVYRSAGVEPPPWTQGS